MRMNLHHVGLALLVALGLLSHGLVPAAERLPSEGMIVHEWGTFTVLQDEAGQELSGINVDDEPVPRFVHTVNPLLLAKPILTNAHWELRQKGAPRHHPLVTMRLETPVIYFYPPKDQREPMTVDVHVKFRGGWLTQFYPLAVFSADPQLENGAFDFGNLSPSTVGTLAWQDLQVGTHADGPETTERVWLAPRKVAAAGVTNSEGESEKYLFYRGVGNQKAPLRVTTNRKDKTLQFHSQFGASLLGESKARMQPLWVVQVKQDGTCAYRVIDGFDVTSDSKAVLAKASYQFAETDFSADNRSRLEADMHTALVKDGLYADEATALLSTWQWSYFESPGVRVFYLVPRQWTDFILPLSISGNPQTERVMIGRIELVSAEQRQLLAKLGKTPASDGSWVDLISDSPARDKFLEGHSNFGDLGVEIPADYQLYLQLGRFRNALVAAEERRHPSPNLTNFINVYQLHPFRLEKEKK